MPHSSNASPWPSAAPTAGRRAAQASAAAAGSRAPSAIAAAARGPATRIAKARNVAYPRGESTRSA
mgnify:CR=1 FL=1